MVTIGEILGDTFAFLTAWLQELSIRKSFHLWLWIGSFKPIVDSAAAKVFM